MFDRAFAVIAALARADQALTVTNLATELAMPVSTLYRILKVLESRGLISHHLSNGITLGPILMDLGLLAHRSIDRHISSRLRPLMIQLTQKHHESAVLMMPAADRAVCVEFVASLRPIRLAFAKGRAMPLYAGAACKTVLAYLPNSIRSESIRNSEGEARADGEHATTLRLRHEVSEIRSLGYCVTEDEINPGTLGIAVPVRLGRDLTGSITLAGSKSRFTPKKIEEVKASLLRIAEVAGDLLSSSSDPLDTPFD